jgi:dTDP-4-amino-4,6-dideoxygalactose transaminase
LIRNHGEAVVEAKGVGDINNIFGYNFRMTEIESAIGIEQIKKLDSLIEKRIKNAEYLAVNLESLSYIDVCKPPSYVKHSYYLQPIRYFFEKNQGLHRDKYLKAISAEIPSSVMREKDPLIAGGYARPLYLQPIYQKKAFNIFKHKPEEINYDKGICPTTERMYNHELITHELMRPSMLKSDLDQVIEGFYKVDKHMNEIIMRQNEL